MTPSATRLATAVRESSDDLLRYFLRRVPNPEDAADALAEVMMIAWRRVDSAPSNPDEPMGMRMWLFGIARNVLLHAQRSHVRRSRLADRLRATLTQREAPAADAGTEVRDAINRLDDDLAELIKLVHWDGFALTEAAEILGIPASTARSRHQKAKRILRASLDPSMI